MNLSYDIIGWAMRLPCILSDFVHLDDDINCCWFQVVSWGPVGSMLVNIYLIISSKDIQPWISLYFSFSKSMSHIRWLSITSMPVNWDKKKNKNNKTKQLNSRSLEFNIDKIINYIVRNNVYMCLCRASMNAHCPFSIHVHGGYALFRFQVAFNRVY